METETVTSTVISGESGEAEAIVTELPPQNPSEEGASDAVTIAAIEAEKETRIEEIHADTAVEIEREITARHEGNEAWRTEVESLRENMTALDQKLEGLIAGLQLAPALTPPPSEEAEAEILEPESETALEPNLIPEFTPEPTSETGTEHGHESEAERPEAEAVVAVVAVRPRRRPI